MKVTVDFLNESAEVLASTVLTWEGREFTHFPAQVKKAGTCAYAKLQCGEDIKTVPVVDRPLEKGEEAIHFEELCWVVPGFVRLNSVPLVDWFVERT